VGNDPESCLGNCLIIAIDSNLLHGRIKIESPQLDSLCDLVGRVGGKVTIPAACVSELHEGAREKHREVKNAISGSVRQAERLGIAVAPGDVESIDDFMGRYRQTLNDYIKKNKIEVIPFPTKMPTVEDLFESAVKKEPPFDKTGNNYRDAVIWTSIEEFASDKNEKVVLVSKDSNLTEMASRKPGPVEVATVDKALDDLKARLDVKEQEKLEKIAQEVMELSIREDFVSLITGQAQKIDFYIEDSAMGGTVQSIDGIEVLAVVDSNAFSTAKCSVKFVANVSYSVEVPSYMREMRTNVWTQLANKPTKIGEKRESVVKKYEKPATSTLFAGPRAPWLNPESPGSVIEKMRKSVVLEATVSVTGSSDQVKSIGLENLVLSEDNPYKFVNLDGTLRGSASET